MKKSTTGESQLTKDAAADLVLWGGKVITLDARNPGAEAVAIKNGRFLKAGKNGEIRALSGRGTEVIALRGRTVTPGFIDSHQHLFEFGTNLLQLDCSPKKCRSLTDIKRVVLKETRRKPPGAWIRGVGYDDTKTSDSPHLKSVGPGRSGAEPSCLHPARERPLGGGEPQGSGRGGG